MQAEGDASASGTSSDPVSQGLIEAVSLPERSTSSHGVSTSAAAAGGGYSFKLGALGSESHETIGSCGWSEFDGLADRVPFDENLPLLIMIGQQKGGTSWFAQALHNHPAIKPPRSPRGCAPPVSALLHLALLFQLHWRRRCTLTTHLTRKPPRSHASAVLIQLQCAQALPTHLTPKPPRSRAGANRTAVKRD